MDAQKRKVTAKLTTSEPGESAPSPTLGTPLVRAKISGTARTRTRTTSAVSAPPSQIVSNGALRPVASFVAARRSPSPSKMQAHLQPNRPVRSTLSKVATTGGSERTRHGSISSKLSSPGQSSTSAPTTPIISNGVDAARSNQPNGSLRVKAKVTGLVKAKSASSASPGPSTPVPPSLSTILSPPSPRAPAPTTSITHHHRTASTPTPQVSPAQLIPLPTSPPTSTISFSSHSSTSTSSKSHVRTESYPMSSLQEDDIASPISPPMPLPPHRVLVARVRPGTHISGGRRSFSGSMSISTGGSASMPDDETDQEAEEDDEDDEDDEAEDNTHAQPEPVDDKRAEAKSNRKIADLEITTRSLLTINASLEATKVRQARELRELRRRLRETRLVLPPRAFRQLPETPTEEESDGDEELEEEDEDETFARLRGLVEGLLDAGRKALAVAYPQQRLEGIEGVGEERAMGQPEVLGWEGGGKHGVAIGSRVLSPEEAGLWAEDGEREGERDDTPVGFARREEDREEDGDEEQQVDSEDGKS